MIRLTNEQREIALELLSYFKIDGQPANEVATEGQVQIFAAIVLELSPRLHIMTCTQYGKSLFIAFACIVLSCLEDEMMTVVAPTDDKAQIIMRYYLQHIGDSPLFFEKLDKQTKIERLQMETTKERVILRKNPKTGKAGGIFTISAQGGNSKKGVEAAMGEGSSKVIEDESCLIPDPQEATVFRMISGKKKAMYVKVGNPFYKDPPNSHFHKSFRDPRYLKVNVDYHQALAEGRYSPDFIAEAKEKPLFSILFENKFPESQVQDDSGYIQLVSEATLDNAYLPEDIDIEMIGEPKMGIDIAGGGRNKSTITIRGKNVARLVFKNSTPDPMILMSKIQEYAKKYKVPLDDRHIFPDKTGIGIAFCARMNELWPTSGERTNNFGVVLGERPEEEREGTGWKQYMNRRAQMCFRTAEWIQRGGKLVGKPAYDEILSIRYKIQSDKKIKIKGKDEMLSDGIESPDSFDSLMLTFALEEQPERKQWKQKEEVDHMTQFGV